MSKTARSDDLMDERSAAEKEVIADMLRGDADPHEVMNFVRALKAVDRRHRLALTPPPRMCEFDGEGWPCSTVRKAMQA